jgi:hypothetical protein
VVEEPKYLSNGNNVDLDQKEAGMWRPKTAKMGVELLVNGIK